MKNFKEIKCLACEGPLRNRFQTKFCSNECLTKFRKPKLEELCCPNCNATFIKKEQTKFCSRSCSASYNNTKRERKLTEVQCLLCNTTIRIKCSLAKHYCKPCKNILNRKPQKEPETYEEEVDRKFFGRILKEDFGKKCWIWQGSKSSEGYGQVTIQGKTIGTHRFSYKYHKKIDPGKYLVCHTCDNPPCVNPNHLWLGTEKDNVHDMHHKGRQYKVPREPWKPHSRFNPKNRFKVKYRYVSLIKQTK